VQPPHINNFNKPVFSKKEYSLSKGAPCNGAVLNLTGIKNAKATIEPAV
jgi:hypothetical protein